MQCDLSAGWLATMDADARDRHLRVQCDEEALPFADASFDVVLSALRFVSIFFFFLIIFIYLFFFFLSSPDGRSF